MKKEGKCREEREDKNQSGVKEERQRERERERERIRRERRGNWIEDRRQKKEKKKKRECKQYRNTKN
jgi:hypothetical protein